MRSTTLALSILSILILAGPALAHCSLDLPNGGEIYEPGDPIVIQWHYYIPHTLENWDLWYAVDAPDTYTFCADQTGPTWIPIVMDLVPQCASGGGGCGIPASCAEEYIWTAPEGIDSDQVKIRVRMDNSGIGDYFDVSNDPFTISPATAVEAPAAHRLSFDGSNPNPFNPRTEIHYSLPSAGQVRLSIHDVAGNRVAVLVDGFRDAGDQSEVWNGQDDSGRALASGVYFARIESAGQVVTGKLTLIE